MKSSQAPPKSFVEEGGGSRSLSLNDDVIHISDDKSTLKSLTDDIGTTCKEEKFPLSFSLNSSVPVTQLSPSKNPSINGKVIDSIATNSDVTKESAEQEDEHRENSFTNFLTQSKDKMNSPLLKSKVTDKIVPTKCSHPKEELVSSKTEEELYKGADIVTTATLTKDDNKDSSSCKFSDITNHTTSNIIESTSKKRRYPSSCLSEAIAIDEESYSAVNFTSIHPLNLQSQAQANLQPLHKKPNVKINHALIQKHNGVNTKKSQMTTTSKIDINLLEKGNDNLQGVDTEEEDKEENTISIKFPLAGPFVYGYLSGHKPVIECMDGDSESVIHQTTSKILSTISRHGGTVESRNDRVSLPLSKAQAIASELVQEHHLFLQQAIRMTFVETKNNHEIIMKKARTQIKSYVDQALQEKDQTITEIKESTSLLVEKHKRTLHKMKTNHEEEMKKIREAYKIETDELEEQLQDERRAHKRSLNALVHTTYFAVHRLKDESKCK